MISDRIKELRYKAPEDLRKELTALASDTSKRQLVINVHFGNWLGAGLGIAAAICLIVWTSVTGHQSTDEIITLEVTNSHIRSMMEDHILDVASTDQHTVKPWFGGKLDFSPSVIDLADIDYPLVGGRLDYISARPVAAVVYKHDRHMINLFTWPSTKNKSEDPVFATSQGFNIWHWVGKSMNYYVVSDLNANSLRDFSEKLREKL